jgi:iron complex outermembrane recepter protein
MMETARSCLYRLACQATLFRPFGALVLALAMLQGQPARAEEPVKTFNIPAQALGSALNAYAEQAGVQLSYPASLATGLKSSGVVGNYTPAQALDKLLVGSGIVSRSTANGTLTLEKPKASEQPQSSTNALPKVTVTGTAAYDPGNPYDENYAITQSAVATKTETPLMETPQSIQVVSRAVMQDQKTSLVKDVLENVSGVRPNNSLTPTANKFIIRGFDNGGRVYRNGLLVLGGYGSAENTFDTANLESVEVLKGPASMLYGRIEPGGLINVTTKRPLGTPFYALEQQFGSYDFYRTLWDAGGPIVKNGELEYRFSGTYQRNNSFRDFVSMDRVLVSPSFTWRPSQSTELNVNLEVFDQNYKADFGLPVIGNRPAPIPISRSLDDPNTPMAKSLHDLINTELTHRFNDSWTLHQRFLASYEDGNSTFVNPAPAFDASQALRDNRIMNRNIFFQYTRSRSFNTNIDLTGKFQLWETRHEVLAGFDFAQGDTQYGYRGYYTIPNPALGIDIFNPGPSYGISRSVFDQALAVQGEGLSVAVARNDWYGIYFQDHMTLFDRFHIMGGGRYDWAESGSAYTPSVAESKATLPSNLRKDERFSPRIGLLYRPVDWFSVYGNWVNSLGSNQGITATGAAQPPQIGKQYEFGFKTEWFDRRLTANLAFYHLNKSNVLTKDLESSNPFATTAIGLSRSRGIELDVTGRVTEDLSVIASYAYTDAVVAHDNSGLEGNRLPNVPMNSGSLWLKYDLSRITPVDGLSVGVGTYVVGARQGDNQNTFTMPGYVRLDTFAAYRFNVGPTRLTAQLNVRNLLDKRYYESTDPNSNVGPRLGVYPGSPLTVLGSLRLEY